MNPDVLRPLWLLLVVAPLACRSVRDQPAPPPAAASGEAFLTAAQLKEAHIDVAEVSCGIVHKPVTTSGRVSFDDQRVSHVFTPVTGRVVRVVVAPGDKVKKGNLLAVIESPDLGQISSDFDKARADFVAAEHDYKRRRALYESHAIAHRDFEAAQDTFERAKAELERASLKSKLLHGHHSELGTVTQAYDVRAPIDGEIITRHVNPGTELQGQYSGGAQSAELFTVGSLDSVWVLSDLFEMDMQRVKVGQPVQLEVVAYPGRLFHGTIAWVSPSVDANTRTVQARCTVANPDSALKPEMFATVTLPGAGNETVSVPRRSIFRLGTKTVVFVQKGTGKDERLRFERREVVVDDGVAGDQIPVSSGLEAGEKLVVAGGYLLTELT